MNIAWGLFVFLLLALDTLLASCFTMASNPSSLPNW